MSRIHVMGPARTVAKARCRPTALPSSRSRCALPLPASARTWQSRFGVPAERLLVARRAHPVRWHAENERALQVEKQLGDDGGVLRNARHSMRKSRPLDLATGLVDGGSLGCQVADEPDGGLGVDVGGSEVGASTSHPPLPYRIWICVLYISRHTPLSVAETTITSGALAPGSRSSTG